MIDPNAELQMLRQRLRFKNLSETVIDAICDDVSREIQSATTDILASAMRDAVAAGESAKSTDFINDIKAVRSGSSFDIVTESGKSDYSEPPFPMLPSLLKNAKVAKDGSLYKVIPVKQKGIGSKSRTRPSTEAAYRAIESGRMEAKQNRDTTNRTSSSPDALAGMDTLSAMQSIAKSRQKDTKMKEKSTEPAVNFRVASSKQDASTQWVNPGRDADMTDALSSINASMHDAIDRVVQEIIRRHEGQY